MVSPALALEIEQANLHAVAYVVVFCKNHHEIRAAITQAPEVTVPQPAVSRTAETGTADSLE